MQMGQGAGYPGGPPPPNFFNLPPGGGVYPSMDPSQAGTRAQRQDGSEAGLRISSVALEAMPVDGIELDSLPMQ